MMDPDRDGAQAPANRPSTLQDLGPWYVPNLEASFEGTGLHDEEGSHKTVV